MKNNKRKRFENTEREMRPPAPFPELIDGEKPWEVRPGLPKVDLTRRIFQVPFGNEELVAQAQAHELSRIKWTPDNPQKYIPANLEVEFVAAAENARLYRMQDEIGMKPKLRIIPDAMVKNIPYMPLREQVLALMEVSHTPDYDSLRTELMKVRGGKKAVEIVEQSRLYSHLDRIPQTNNIKRQIEEIQSEIADYETEGCTCEDCLNELKELENNLEYWEDQLGDDPEEMTPINFAATVECANYMSSMLIAHEQAEQERANSKADHTERELGGDEFEKMLSENTGYDPWETIDTALMNADQNARDAMRKGGDDERRLYTSLNWAKMKVEEPSRPLRLPPALRSRGRTVHDHGAIPVAMHRATSDGRIFRAARRKEGGGAVLIDGSGSMGFNANDIQKIMVMLPAGVIAVYSLDGSDDGYLRIIARGGKRVADDKLMTPGGGNGVDGPALHWLADQRGPRFWVSDGHATGCDDHGGYEHRVYCMVYAQRHRILRVPNISDLHGRLNEILNWR